MKNEQSNETITIQKDGNMWCAFRESFINLQESLSGFGDTAQEALNELLKEEANNDNDK